MGRTLGIDFGEAAIGVAISDPDGRYALPLTTVRRDTDRRAVYRIADLIADERIDEIVIGMPERPDGGRDDETCTRVERFGRKLERATRRPVRFVGEALTSIEARARLAAAGATAEGDDHAVAAQVILEDALGRRDHR